MHTSLSKILNLTRESISSCSRKESKGLCKKIKMEKEKRAADWASRGNLHNGKDKAAAETEWSAARDGRRPRWSECVSE